MLISTKNTSKVLLRYQEAQKQQTKEVLRNSKQLFENKWCVGKHNISLKLKKSNG